MKAGRNYILAAALALVFAGASGCAGPVAARHMATRLRAAVVQDERLVNENIEAQERFYQEQSQRIEQKRAENQQFNVDAFRRGRSAHIATRMSSDPNQEARLSNLMDALVEAHDQEFQLWLKLYASDQQEREELQSKIASLQRQKELLSRVKDNLDQLSLGSTSKQQAQRLLKLSEDTYEAYKGASKK